MFYKPYDLLCGLVSSHFMNFFKNLDEFFFGDIFFGVIIEESVTDLDSFTFVVHHVDHVVTLVVHLHVHLHLVLYGQSLASKV